MKLVELGALTGLETRSRVLVWNVRGAPVLAYSEDGRLFVVYPRKLVRPASEAELKAYARTHGGARGRSVMRDGRVADVGPWTSLGKGVAITYTTKKGSERELTDYRHEWGDGGPRKFTPPTYRAHRCGNAKCAWNGAISLVGGSYTVTERGIVG